MRLTHVHLYETNSCTHMWDLLTLFFYNQSDGLRLSEQFFTPNLLLYNFIFTYKLITIVTRHCVAATYYAALSLSFALYNIILIVPSSAAPHIKVILPPNSTTQEVTLFHPFRTWRLLKIKTKSFSIIMLSSKISVSQSNCGLYLLYLTLTLLGYVFLVWSLITG